MELINKIKNILKNNLGITFVEIMIAISILAIGMTYVAVDAKYSTRSLYVLDEKENMLNAEQEALEVYKINETAGQYTYNGYVVEITVDTDKEVDENLTGGLKKITIEVNPKDPNFTDSIQLVSYVFSRNTSAPTAPTGLIASPTLNGVVLEWNAPMYANSYIVKRSTTAGGPYDIVAENVTTNRYTDTTAQNNLTYYYVVAAVNTYGTSPDSTEVNTMMQINTDTLNPVADAYIDSWSDETNYGRDASLKVCGSWFGEYQSYLKFNYTYITGSIISAKLRLYGKASSNMTVNIYGVSDDSWLEDEITWNNSPIEDELIDSVNFNSTSKYREIDVTDYCKAELASNKIASFLVNTTSSKTTTINSKDNTGNPPNMPELVITWTPMQPPPTPQNLKGFPDNKQAILSWDASVGAENYVVRRSTAHGGPYTIVNSSVSTNSFTDTGLTNGVTYYYVVSAINGNGESGYSNEVSVVPNYVNTVTYAPEADAYVRDGTYANTNFGSSLTLESRNSTSAGEKRITYYQFDLNNLRGTVLTAKLRMYGSNIQDYADVTLGCYDVTDESWEESAINYSNAPALGNEIGSGAIYSTPSYREVDITSYVQSKMTTDKIINIATQVKDSSSLVSFSSKENTSNIPKLVITKTLLAPLAPANLDAVPFDRKVSLAWDASNEADTYTVKRSTTDGGPYSTIASGVTATSYDDTAVTNGTKYYYVITATNTAGQSPNSNQACATPNVVELHTLNPVEDARVESYFPSRNYALDALQVVNDGQNNKKSYLKFDFTGINNNTTVSAILRVYGNSTVNNFKVNAYKVSNTTWTEGSINWNNSPALEDIIGTANVNIDPADKAYNIDITDYVAATLQSQNVVSIGLYTDIVGDNSTTFNNDEVANAALRPQLLVNMVAGVPRVPQSLTAVGGNRLVNLSWTASEGAQTYNVKRSTASGGPYTTVATGLTATTYQNTGLTNGTRYYYIVTASNTVGESITSNEACGIPANASNTQALTPTDDAYVRNGTYASTNYGTAANLDVSYSITPNNGNTRYIYIKFDESSIPSNPTSATLYITGRNITNGFSTTVTVYQLTNDAWDENTINWNNAPTSGTSLGTMSFRGTAVTRTLSITNYAKTQWAGDKVVGLCLKVSSTGRVISCNSKEGTTDPILQVNY